jgi:hypothetical protein
MAISGFAWAGNKFCYRSFPPLLAGATKQADKISVEAGLREDNCV